MNNQEAVNPETHLTTGQVSRLLEIPSQRVRRIADRLWDGKLPRFGNHWRAITAKQVDTMRKILTLENQ